MKKYIAILLLTGCASFTVTQRDESPNERIVTTQVKATTFLSSAQAIKNAQASQNNTTQKVGAESVTQSATNTAELLRWVGQILTTVPR